MAALTLAQSLVGHPNVVAATLVDEFPKSSYIFEKMPFTAMAQAGGNGWVYQYQRVTTDSSATVRAINAEYTEAQALQTAYTVNLKVLGGSFKIDRAIVDLNNSASSIEKQARLKTKATIAKFQDLFINGDLGTTPEEFDGISDMVTGSSTEVDGASIDLSTAANITTNYHAFLDLLGELISKLDGTPSALFMPAKMKLIMESIGRRVTGYQTTNNEFGVPISTYNGIPLIDLGAKPASTSDIIPTAVGLTSIYAVRFGEDGVHGLLPSNKAQALNVIIPDMKSAGAVKTGEVELITAIAMETSRCAAKLKSIKVA